MENAVFSKLEQYLQIHGKLRLDEIDRSKVANPATLSALFCASTPFLHHVLGSQRMTQLKVSTASKKMRGVTEDEMRDVPPGGGGGDDAYVPAAAAAAAATDDANDESTVE